MITDRINLDTLTTNSDYTFATPELKTENFKNIKSRESIYSKNEKPCQLKIINHSNKCRCKKN